MKGNTPSIRKDGNKLHRHNEEGKKLLAQTKNKETRMKKMQGIGFLRDDAGREEPEPVPLTASSSFCFLIIFLPML
jgi:hypothetical protein